MEIIDINGNLKTITSIAPDPAYPGYLKVTFPSKRHQGQTLTEWYPTGKFLTNNPKLAHMAGNDKPLPEEIVGVVTSAKKDSLQDATQTWFPNAYVGFPVWISRGKGEGQTRTIKTNTKYSLTLEKNWGIVPDHTSQYVISLNVHTTTPQGNSLPLSEPIIPESQDELN